MSFAPTSPHASASASTAVALIRRASSGCVSHPATSWNAAQFTTASGRSRETSARKAGGSAKSASARGRRDRRLAGPLEHLDEIGSELSGGAGDENPHAAVTASSE